MKNETNKISMFRCECYVCVLDFDCDVLRVKIRWIASHRTNEKTTILWQAEAKRSKKLSPSNMLCSARVAHLVLYLIASALTHDFLSLAQCAKRDFNMWLDTIWIISIGCLSNRYYCAHNYLVYIGGVSYHYRFENKSQNVLSLVLRMEDSLIINDNFARWNNRICLFSAKMVKLFSSCDVFVSICYARFSKHVISSSESRRSNTDRHSHKRKKNII